MMKTKKSDNLGFNDLVYPQQGNDKTHQTKSDILAIFILLKESSKR